ncbi:MAG TPA: vanadium-dependent haloperoxidase [Verrucomicrobiae bacterium]|nr:vanadium-dependent haloperoxidase [Verrucomicrobiae bacterium]
MLLATTLRAATAFLLLATTAAGAEELKVSPDTGQAFVTVPPGTLVHRVPAEDFKPTAAYRWLEILLEASGRDAVRNKPRPTVLSRTDGMILTAMYDAWAAYDDKAVGTRLGGKLRRPKAERTTANKEVAIAYAAYRVLLFVYPEDAEWIRERMRAEGHDPDHAGVDTRTPRGIGNAAAAALIEYRKHDGANQLGDDPAGNGKAYSDTTGYQPLDATAPGYDWTRWQPIPFADGKGGTVSPGFLTPQWGRIKPVALERGDQFRAPEPPRWGSAQLEREIREVAEVNANLTLEQKAVVEFMREGPRSTGQSGHWLQFAQDVSRRDGNDLDRDIKLFFVVGNVVMDAFIACWDSKRHYDTGRPYWWVRHHYRGKTIPAWLGPGKGFGTLRGETWLPYSPDTFITPPFPGYVSGHATASGAAARMLELFTGSDRFGVEAWQMAGTLTGEGTYTGAQMQARASTPAAMPVSVEVKGAAADPKLVHLVLPSFSATAEMAAVSRLWGGFHIRTDNEEGLILGRKVAMYSWPKYQALFEGR